MLVYVLSWRVDSKRRFWVLSMASEQRFARLGPVADDVGFIGLFMAIVSESVHPKLAIILLFPALLLGVGSVIYWHWYDDLRFYAWVQYAPLLILPVLLALFPSQYSHRYMLLVALACYLLAKLFEVCDREVFAILHGRVSGHAIKHLWAAAACLSILQMLRKRHFLNVKRAA